MIKKICIMKAPIMLASFLVVFSLFMPKVVEADISLGTAILLEVKDDGVEDGDIISSEKAGEYLRANTPYDPFLFGVVSLKPAVYLYDKSSETGVPIITVGKAYVRVSTEKGTIKHGDQVTSSTTPGVGVKATQNGFIVGTALEDYIQDDPKKIAKILVAVEPRFAQMNNNLISTIFSAQKLSFSPPALSSVSIFRYVIAFFIAIAAFIAGFRFFGYASIKGVEAIGRNPLAKKTIVASVLINAVLTVVVMLFGFAISYLVLVF